ncbi:MAG: hypothetical protein QNK43_05890 [Amphritea sp.]|nr:hypothetical protein [Amphritea sp.]
MEPARSTRHPLTANVSFKEELTQLPFSPYEIDKLQESESYSDDLVNLEVQAFNAMDGLFKSNNGRYDVKGEPNQTLAIEVLYSNAYLKAKEKNHASHR